MSRVIDYALARDVDVHTSAGDFHGSDHRAVVFDCLRGRHRLRVGLWNVERDRDPDKVVRQVLDVIETHRLDALAICEASDYVDELRRIPGWHFLTGWARRPGSRETALLVRVGVELAQLNVVQLTRAGWITVRGGRTAPKWAPVVQLAGWLHVAVVHLPPSVRFANGRHAPAGPARRVVAYLAAMRSVRGITRRRQGPLLVVGDWNAVPASRRHPMAPAGLARRLRLRIAAPKIGTHR